MHVAPWLKSLAQLEAHSWTCPSLPKSSSDVLCPISYAGSEQVAAAFGSGEVLPSAVTIILRGNYVPTELPSPSE